MTDGLPRQWGVREQVPEEGVGMSEGGGQGRNVSRVTGWESGCRGHEPDGGVLCVRETGRQGWGGGGWRRGYICIED